MEHYSVQMTHVSRINGYDILMVVYMWKKKENVKKFLHTREMLDITYVNICNWLIKLSYMVV